MEAAPAGAVSSGLGFGSSLGGVGGRSASTVGAETVTIVASAPTESLAPAGSLIASAWTESPMFRPATDTSMDSGMLSGSTVTSRAVLDDLDQAAVLDAGALLLTDDVHRNLDRDGLALGDAQEVDMDREILDRVELVIARNDALLLTSDADLEDRGQEVAAENQLAGLVGVERDGFGSSAPTIDHGRRLALAANSTSGPLADLCARRSLDLLHGGHVGCP
jgi:hypothetical protein